MPIFQQHNQYSTGQDCFTPLLLPFNPLLIRTHNASATQTFLHPISFLPHRSLQQIYFCTRVELNTILTGFKLTFTYIRACQETGGLRKMKVPSLFAPSVVWISAFSYRHAVSADNEPDTPRGWHSAAMLLNSTWMATKRERCKEAQAVPHALSLLLSVRTKFIYLQLL